ncbi:MAG: hypothetical protein ACRDZ4_00945 [Egibacteraceae bacterium]
MPAYDFSCTENPDHRKDNIIFGIHEYDENTLKDKACEELGCPGVYEHTFENARPGHSFKGDGWTPKFHR